ncbi:MAG TPA: efflux RND transporter periplasmic adaptor subunit [Thermoanaerobaculia bacterium]|nr:efflux RND transporter periplasmic adaptor subunit [Thermoanaerobaculia bacterium]
MKRVLILLLAVTIAACNNKKDDGTIHLNGRIEAPTVDLGPKVAGRVVEVLVREGDRVKAGALLVRLDLGETAIAVEREQAGVRSAQARAEDAESGSRESEIAAAQAEVLDRRVAVGGAEKEVERQRFLFSRKVGTERDYDQARITLERAKAALKISQERLDLVREGSRRDQTKAAEAETERAQAVLRQTVAVAREGEIRAPADGVIVHRLAEPGQLVGAGQSAVTMAFANRLYVRTFIPETQLGKVRMGTAARVTVDAFPGREFPARITEIAPEAEFTPKQVETKSERVNLVFAAKADLDRGWNEPLVPGQPAELIVRVK